MSTDLGQLVYRLTLDDTGFAEELGASDAKMAASAESAKVSSDSTSASLAKISATADQTAAQVGASADSMAASAAKTAEAQSASSDKQIESMAKTKTATEETSSGMSKLGLGAAAVAVGIGLVADKTVKAAVEYQDQLTALVTGAGENESNIDMIRSNLLKMSVDTATTTSQLTSGLYMIESAGFHGAQGLAVLKAAAEGAKVGQADLGTVSDATTTIMKDFGGTLPTQAVNTLIATVANGKTHMQDLALSLSQVAPTAAASKVSLNDMMGAMATMTGEGVPAANAATYLRQTIIGLAAPGSAAVKALQSVGLSSSDVAAEMQKSLPDALKMITDAVGKKFPEGSAAYVNAIKNISGGSKTMQGMLDLTGDHMKDFQSNVKAVSDQVKEGGKTVVGWSEVQKDAKFQQDAFKASIATTGIALGEALLPALTAIAKALADMLKPIAEWVTSHKKLAATIVEVVAALSMMVLTIVAVTKAIKFMGTVMELVADTNPIILAIMALAVVAIVIVNYWSDVKQWFDDFWNWIKSNWQTVAVIFAPFLALPMLIVSNWKTISQWFSDFWNWLKSSFSDVLNFVKDHWALIVDIILGPLGIVVTNIIEHWNSIKNAFVDAVNFVKSVWNSIVGFFGNIMDGIINGIRNGVSGFGSLLWNAGSSLVDGLEQGITNTASKVFDAVKNIGSKAVSALRGVLKIFSPSRVFADLGANVSLGLAQGINSMADAPVQATTQMATSVAQAGSIPNVVNNSSSSSFGGVTYSFAGANFNFHTPEAVDEFFSIGNRNTQLELNGLSPMAGTTGV